MLPSKMVGHPVASYLSIKTSCQEQPSHQRMANATWIEEKTLQTQVIIPDIYWWLIMCQALCYWVPVTASGGVNRCCSVLQMRELKPREVNFLAEITQPSHVESGLGWVWLQRQHLITLWCLYTVPLQPRENFSGICKDQNCRKWMCW